MLENSKSNCSYCCSCKHLNRTNKPTTTPITPAQLEPQITLSLNFVSCCYAGIIYYSCISLSLVCVWLTPNLLLFGWQSLNLLSYFFVGNLFGWYLIFLLAISSVGILFSWLAISYFLVGYLFGWQICPIIFLLFFLWLAMCFCPPPPFNL